MTETTSGRRAVSDIAEADYRAITDLTHELHTRIHYLMARTEGPRDTAWNELYELMQLTHVIGTAADRYADRAQLPREPVDYRPAGDVYRKRLEYGMADCAPFENER